MTRARQFSWGHGLLAVLLALAGPAAGRGADLTAGWEALTNYQAGEALRIFAAGEASTNPATVREARFGRGVALLTRQPVTAGQIDEARGLFRALAESGADDFALGARFYLGRIAQHHQETPDPDEAARQFRLLLNEHPDSVWSQSALSRLALLQLYALDPGFTPDQRIAAAKKLLALARVPAAEGEVHIAIAEAIFYYRLPGERALPHLLAAERLGGYDRVGRADILLQIAELSRLAGLRAQAAKFYHLFLKENPRDSANYNARMHLAEVEPPAAAPAKR
ncbi:MAG: tetratricopeptide repeat protein [Verrucomicrobia bacterium]|nr:tetratricopeptide repeat protein [Verrucomicrobiota bacterium]